jgi:hypothetical protein
MQESGVPIDIQVLETGLEKPVSPESPLDFQCRGRERFELPTTCSQSWGFNLVPSITIKT